MQEASETRYGQLPTRYEESECGPTRQSFTENNRATRSTVDVYHINASWLPHCNRGLAYQLPRADTPLNIGSIDVHCAISYLLTHKLRISPKSSMAILLKRLHGKYLPYDLMYSDLRASTWQYLMNARFMELSWCSCCMNFSSRLGN